MAKPSGKQLTRRYGIDVRHALYRKSGDWYHILREFPAALVDETGYLRFDSRSDYESFVTDGAAHGVKEYPESNTLTIIGGISIRQGYVPFQELALFPDELSPSATFVEGAARRVLVNSYERDPRARRLCIKRWGVNCSVCDFNFAHMYGDLGTDFIHVHHLTPVASVKAEYVLHPEEDMRPVCPNCHAMLHRRDPPYSIAELVDLVRANKGHGA